MPTRREPSAPVHVSVILAIGLVSFSFSPILVRLASEAPSLALVAWRALFAVIFLLPFSRRHHWAAYRRLGGRDVVRIVVAGMLLGVHFYLFFESLYHTTVASTTIIVALSPIFMAVIGHLFLGERLPAVVLASIVAATVGGVLIGAGDAGSARAADPAWGNLLAVGASLTMSVYLIIGRVARRGMDWYMYVLPLYAVSALTVVGIAVSLGVPLLSYPPKIYLLCALMALGPQLLGHGSFNLAVKYFTAAVLGLFALTEPIGSSILAYFLFSELPAPVSILGMTIALAAIGLALSPSLVGKARER